MERRGVYTAALLYLFLPLAIFLGGWVNPALSVPLIVAGAASVLLMFRDLRGKAVTGSPKTEWLILIILSLWVVGSGIGGYVWQNQWDHAYRNAVFADLISRPFPVADGDSILVYYFGFWLPAAGLAKLTGSVAVGEFLLLIYAIIGIYLGFRIFLDLIGNVKWRYLLIFILFSGMDIAGFLLYQMEFKRNLHMELWSPLCFWESNTTVLYWVYNQAIPAWVATMLLISQWKRKGVTVATLCYLFLSAPFSVVGLSLLGVYYLIKGTLLQKGTRRRLGFLFSPHNIIAFLAVIPALIFFKLNTSTTVAPVFTFGALADLAILLLLEIGIFVPFIHKQLRHNATFWILLATAILCLFIRMGHSFDFNSRVELPLSYLLTLMVARFTKDWKSTGKTKRYLFVAVFGICAITPLLELSRTAYQTLTLPREEYKPGWFATIFEIDRYRSNFVVDNADIDRFSWLYRFPAPQKREVEIKVTKKGGGEKR